MVVKAEQKNLYRFWFVLLIISGVIAVYFMGDLLKDLWIYGRYSEKASAQIYNWNVVEVPASYFSIEAQYRYFADGRVYENKSVFKTPRFLNRFAAEHEVRSFQAKKWNAWYIKNKPYCSHLSREFPLKGCFNALLTLGVFIYFYFARGLIRR